MSFIIIRNDISKTSADAIVCTASPTPAIASGTEKAIYKAAGAEKLMAERERLGTIMPGEAFITPAFDLDAKYILHTVGPVWDNGEKDEPEVLRKCYENCLRIAIENDCESIAFPLLATGYYNFPKAEALRIAVSVFTEFLSHEEMEIILVVFDEKSFELSDKIFSSVREFVDKNYVKERFHEEYDGNRTIVLSSSGISAFDMAKADFDEVPDDITYDAEPDEDTGDMICAEEPCDASPEATVNRLYGRLFEAEAEAAPRHTVFGAPEKAPRNMLVGAAPAAAGTGKRKESLRSLKDVIANVDESWQECLFRLIDEKAYTDTEVYKRANMDRKLFSKIRSNKDYQPRKTTALSLALALKLNKDETRDFLRKAGLALSPSSIFDLIIEYFINEGIYDIYTINLALFEHKQPLLGE